MVISATWCPPPCLSNGELVMWDIRFKTCRLGKICWLPWSLNTKTRWRHSDTVGAKSHLFSKSFQFYRSPEYIIWHKTMCNYWRNMFPLASFLTARVSSLSNLLHVFRLLPRSGCYWYSHVAFDKHRGS